MPHPTRVQVVLGIVTALIFTGCVQTPETNDAPDNEPDTTAATPTAIEDFYDQTISWAPCDDAADFQCGTVDVPLDYTNPADAAIQLHVTRPVETADESPMLFNPGGPGSSGIDFVQRSLGLMLSDELARNISPIGFDPRGVGLSEPIRCQSDAEFDRDRQLAFDTSTPEGWEASTQRHTEFAEQCLERSGDIVKFADTVSAAKDMDILRAALGQEQLDYFGISYGTKLGATYAELFPDTVGKFVLDSILPPGAETLEVTKSQSAGFEQSLNEWAAWCAQTSECALGEPGDPDSVLNAVTGLIERVEDEPLQYPNGRSQPASDLFFGIIVGLYSTDSRDLLAAAFEEAINNDFTDNEPLFLYLADVYLGRSMDGSYNNNMDAFSVINCLDYTQPDKTLKQAAAEAEEIAQHAPIIGPAMSYSTGCNGWPYEPTEVIDKAQAEGSAPIVVANLTSDPATPLHFSEQLAEDLDNSVHIVKDGSGHGAYSPEHECIVDAIDQYILADELPADGLVCQ